MQTIDPIIREEMSLLENNRRILLENPIGFDNSAKELVEQLVSLRNEIVSAKEEDLPSLYNQMDQLNASLKTMEQNVGKDEVDPDSPYFAHMRLEENGRKRDVFIGKATNLDNGLRIVDWRNAPISKLFYRYTEGDEYEEEFGQQVREGTILLRRILHIQRGELYRVSNSQTTWIRNGDTWQSLAENQVHLAGGQGSAFRAGSTLTSQLGAGVALRANKHLPDIAALIDPEQFELISAQHNGIMVIRGSAGSGKTTVALHRIAYLCFDNPKRFVPENMMFIVWGKAMRDYVSHVLPHLGVKKLKVTTWKNWAIKTFKEHFPTWPKITKQITPDAVREIKLHPKTASRLKQQILSTPEAPQTLEQVYDDWAQVLTDFSAIEEYMEDSWSVNMKERAESWLANQSELLSNWMEGDRGNADTDVEIAFLDFEDVALFLYAYQLRIGKLTSGGGKIALSHLVLDEVQDFSPIEVLVLLGVCDKHQSVTLAGDTRQHISKSAGFSSWSEFLDQIGVATTALSTLQVAYRSTTQIVDFAMKLVHKSTDTDSVDSDDAPPRTVKQGPPVEFFRFAEHGACVAFLSDELRKLQHKEPRANVALLTPSMEISEMYYNGLLACELDNIRLIVDQEFAFAPGIDVVDVEQVKGLEFDYVIVVEVSAFEYPNSPYHQRLLHVACTRAVHQLWLTCVGTPTALLSEVLEHV